MSLLQFNFCGSSVQHILFHCCDNYFTKKIIIFTIDVTRKLQYQVAMSHI